MSEELTIDGLAQEIRRLDGNNTMGAGALAEGLFAYISSRSPDAGKAEPVGALGWDQTPVEATWSDGAVHSYVDLKAALAWQSRQWIVDLGTRIVSVRPLFAHPQPPQPSPGVGEAVETVARAIDPDAFEWLDDVRSRGDEGRMTHASWAPIRKAESAAARVLAALSSARVEAEEERDRLRDSLNASSDRLIEATDKLLAMHERAKTAEARIATLEAERKADGEVFERIATWFGQFPETGRFWTNDDGSVSDRPMSYGACWGSNGERDFMRELARQRLAAHQKGGE